jgi:hypothetical protein
VTDSGSIICIGGIPNGTSSASDAVYFASLDSGGVGSWHQASNYPVGVETACAVAAGDLYCVGGYQDSTTISEATYYEPITTLTAT